MHFTLSFILIIFYLHDVLNVYTVWSSDCNSKYPAFVIQPTHRLGEEIIFYVHFWLDVYKHKRKGF